MKRLYPEKKVKNSPKKTGGIFRAVSSKENNKSVNLLFDILIDELSKINFESRSDSYVLEKKNFLKKKKRSRCCDK